MVFKPCNEGGSFLQSDAKRYERTDFRKSHRYSFKPRILPTKYGELDLLNPQSREFSFETGVFEKYSRVEKAILTAVSESTLGVSTPSDGKDNDCFRSRRNLSFFCFEDY